jgi:hypothetical protein
MADITDFFDVIGAQAFLHIRSFLGGRYTNKKPALRSILRAGEYARGTTSFGVKNSHSAPGSAAFATPGGPANGGLPNTSRVACISHAVLSFHRPQLAAAFNMLYPLQRSSYFFACSIALMAACSQSHGHFCLVDVL